MVLLLQLCAPIHVKTELFWKKPINSSNQYSNCTKPSGQSINQSINQFLGGLSSATTASSPWQ